MRPVVHIPRSIDGLKKAVDRGIYFYFSLCGSIPSIENLGTREQCGCGACAVLSDAEEEAKRKAEFTQLVEPRAPLSVSLSEWDEIEKSSQAPASSSPSSVGPSWPDLGGSLSGASMSTSQMPPLAPVPYEELCSRLALDPAADPAGKLGSLARDVREVLTPQERLEAAPILGMVKGIPMGSPLVQTVYRLCHELTWHKMQGAST